MIKNLTTLLVAVAALWAVPSAHAQKAQIKETGAGTKIGTAPNQLLGFYGAPPTAQRSGVAESGLTLTTGTGAFTFTATPVVNDTVAIGSGTYTFKSTLSSTTANQVLISGSSGSAANLIAAIDGAAGSGTSYSLLTVANTNVVASTGSTASIASLTALLGGTNANLLALTASGTSISASGSFMAGGAQFTDTNAAANLLNEIRAALVQKGLIKGSP